MNPILANFPYMVLASVIGLLFLTVIAVFAVYATLYRKVEKGRAMVRTGFGDPKVSFSGMLVFPVFHRLEYIDISVKRIEIDRSGHHGLICKDNMRADIKVAFFVRVNNKVDDVLKVAESIGCARASSLDEIRALFDAKFSEALKTVGKRFEFTELYEERDTFRDETIKIIGTNLNGFVLDDVSIDHLEQTPVEQLDANNILDSEGIKKITELTAEQAKLANNIQRDKEKVIKQQDVVAREAILELERQLAETEARQQREIATVQSREEAEAARVKHEENRKAEQARIQAEEEIHITEENKQRQVLVALRNKERTDAVELERVERDRDMERIERERLTQLKQIESDKAVEEQKRDIQEVIKERVAVEKTVVEEQQRIKDTEAFATAEREKKVAVTLAEKSAQEELIARIKEAEASQEAAKLKADEDLYRQVRAAEAAKQAADLRAEEVVILAEAERTAAEKQSAAKQLLAEAAAAEAAAPGLGEVKVIEAKADAIEKQGTAEATVSRLKFEAEADGIERKAGAMKLFEEAGQEHEEFKLKLDKERAVDLATIDAQREVAGFQSQVLADALKTARIDIVGGDSQFFDRLTGAVGMARSLDRALDNSPALQDVKDTFFNGDPDYFKAQVRSFVDQVGLSSADMKNLSLSALLAKLAKDAKDEPARQRIASLSGLAERLGLGNQKAADLLK